MGRDSKEIFSKIDLKLFGVCDNTYLSILLKHEMILIHPQLNILVATFL